MNPPGCAAILGSGPSPEQLAIECRGGSPSKAERVSTARGFPGCGDRFLAVARVLTTFGLVPLLRVDSGNDKRCLMQGHSVDYLRQICARQYYTIIYTMMQRTLSTKVQCMRKARKVLLRCFHASTGGFSQSFVQAMPNMSKRESCQGI